MSGKITQDEIDNVRKLRKKYEKDNNITRKRILDELKTGKNDSQIARDIGMKQTTVNRIKKELISEGKISEDEILKAREIAKKNKMHKKEKPNVQLNQELYIDKKSKALELLQVGISTRQICRILEIDADTWKKLKEELISEGKITKESIKAAQENREIKVKQRVLVLALQGYTYTEIAELIEYAEKQYIVRIANELKAEGKLNDETIENARKEKITKEREFIGIMLKKGFSCMEISRSEEAKKKNISYTIIKKYQEDMMKNGEENEVIIAQERRKANESKERMEREEPFDNTIFELSELGFPTREIAKFIGKYDTYVNERKQAMRRNGIMSKENYREVVMKREELAVKRRTEIISMINYNKDCDVQTINRHLMYAKVKLELNNIESSDIKLLSKAIQLSSDLMTLENIKFIAKGFTRLEDYRNAIKFLEKCIENCYEDEQPKIDKIKLAIDEIKKKRDKQRKLRETSKTKSEMPKAKSNVANDYSEGPEL